MSYSNLSQPSSTTQKSFWMAIETEDLNLLSDFIQRCYPINNLSAYGNEKYKNHIKWSPLCAACFWNKKTVVQLFLQSGAKINLPSEFCLYDREIIFDWRNYKTPLHYAITAGNKEIIEMLLEFYVNVSCGTYKEALICDCGCGFMKTVPPYTRNAMELAVEYGQSEIIEFIKCHAGPPCLKGICVSLINLFLEQKKMKLDQVISLPEEFHQFFPEVMKVKIQSQYEKNPCAQEEIQKKARQKILEEEKVNNRKFQLEEKKKGNLFSIEDLQMKNFPSTKVVQSQLESYLTDEDFEVHFKMAKNEFYQLSLWKQQNLKKDLKLF